MPEEFFKLDIHFFEHPKIIGLRAELICAYLESVAYANRFRTDGHLVPVVVRRIIGGWDCSKGELVDAGLWEPAGDGYQIHNFAEHNRTRAEIEKQRAQWRDRQQKHRSAIVTRDSQATGDRESRVTHGGVTRKEVEVDQEQDLSEPKNGSSSAPDNGAVLQLQPQRSPRAAQAAVGVIEWLKQSVDAGNRSWSFSDAMKAEWDELLDDDGNLTAARDFLVWFLAEMRGSKPERLDWQMAMQKVKRHRSLALYGVEEAVTRHPAGGIELWKYVEAVCVAAKARNGKGSS